jgi:glycopeptide antibiotics resistance protein
VFGILSDIFLWAFIAWLYLKSAQYSPKKIFKLCMLYAVGIELAQLLVLSRFSDTTDILSAFIGISFALKYLGNRDLEENAQSNTAPGQDDAGAFSLFGQEMAVILWAGGLFLLAIYPVELVQGKAALMDNIQRFFSVPFETYWRGGPLQAVTQLFRKVLLVVPLGLLLASVADKHKLTHSYRLVLAFLAVGFLLGLELLQIFIVSKVAVASDVALNLLGFYLGRKVYLMHSSKKEENTEKPAWLQAYKQYYGVFVLVVISLALLLIHGDERTPYNVKELFNSDFVWLSAFMMALSFLVAFALPPILVNRFVAINKTSAMVLLGATVGHCLLVFNLFYVTFPNESLHDILGYPTWGDNTHYLELGYRFLGFYLPLSGAFFLVYTWLASTNSVAFRANKLAFTLVYLFLILPVAYLIVVVQAGTDNIIELLPNQGHSFKLLFIIGYLLLLVYVAAWWVKRVSHAGAMGVITHFILTLALAPFGYFLVQHGLQDVIIKYGKVFSGMQFILSPTRDSLLSDEQMLLRFMVLHFMLLAMFYISGFTSRTFSLESISFQKKLNRQPSR